MVQDRNKDIETISYNHLNLPTSVVFGSGDDIIYIYDATGTKLKKLVNEEETIVEYANGYVYENGSLKFFNHPEGYVEPYEGSYDYIYQYKDHLGNVRLSYKDSNSNGEISASTEILEENNYYPFGLKHQGYNNVVNGVDHPYGFQEQEEQNELGLNWIQFKWRNHDPAIGRFFNIDPLADKYVQWTPYAFSGNRVIDAFELEGLEPVDAKKGAKHLVVVIQGFWGEPGKNKTLVSNTPMAVDNTGLGAVEQGFGNKSNIQVATYNSSRESGTIGDVTETINNFMTANPDGKIIMVGHSLRADNAINVANETGHEIELMVTLDIADYWDSDNAPSNVNNVVNIYQTNDFPGGEDVEAKDGSKTNVQNFNAKKSTHRSIDQDFIGTILQMIQNLTQTTPNSTSAGQPASHKNVDKDEQ